MLKEFKDFIASGDVIDFAVAVIMAGAIGLVINSFVVDIVMPVVGHFLLGGKDFANWMIQLSPAVGVEGEEGFKAANAVRIGVWINTIINLLSVGLVMFFIIKGYNKMRGPVAAPGPTQEELLTEIRDLLKK